MTEAEWLACEHPRFMLEYLRGRGSGRKLRLFACACCRRIWQLLADKRFRQAVKVAELYADGQARKAELVAARDEAAVAALKEAEQRAARGEFPAHYAQGQASLHPALCVARPGPRTSRLFEWTADRAAATVAKAAGYWGRITFYPGWGDEMAAQISLLREVFGNPFRPVTLDPAWLSWKDATVVKLAQAVYDERAFDRMPVLADALEDAGCDNTDILDHCRGPATHVRGCWVVDLILGKE
jgi:hypothetical protein